jgi:hypothetical protein
MWRQQQPERVSDSDAERNTTTIVGWQSINLVTFLSFLLLNTCFTDSSNFAQIFHSILRVGRNQSETELNFPGVCDRYFSFFFF